MTLLSADEKLIRTHSVLDHIAVLDVMCSYGPLFPSAQYKLATQFLIPSSSYVAIALAGIILIFPQTMSHLWLYVVAHDHHLADACPN